MKTMVTPKRIVFWGICLLGENTTMGLRRDRPLAWNENWQVEHVEEGRTIRIIPPTFVYPLIVFVLDRYESEPPFVKLRF